MLHYLIYEYIRNKKMVIYCSDIRIPVESSEESSVSTVYALPQSRAKCKNIEKFIPWKISSYVSLLLVAGKTKMLCIVSMLNMRETELHQKSLQKFMLPKPI